MIKIGTTEVTNIMIGESQVQKMYLGTNLVWEHNQDFFCKLELTDGSIISLEGQGELTNTMLSPYKTTLAKLHVGGLSTTIGYQAALQFSKMTELIIDDGCLSIDNQAFNGTRLTKIDLPSSLVSIGDYTFHNMGSDYCEITIRASTPPSIPLGKNNRFGLDNTRFYVPSSSLEIYKNTWSSIENRIYPIPS